MKDGFPSVYFLHFKIAHIPKFIVPVIHMKNQRPDYIYTVVGVEAMLVGMLRTNSTLACNC